MHKQIYLLFFLGIASILQAGDSIRPGLEPLERRSSYSRADQMTQEELQLIDAIKAPLLAGYDVANALQYWFDGRLQATRHKKSDAIQSWEKGFDSLSNLVPLPLPIYESPKGTPFQFQERIILPKNPQITCKVVKWTCNHLTEYGIIMLPDPKLFPGKRPLILYVHGAAFGIPDNFLIWLAKNLAARGYAVIAPAMRGEQLWQRKQDNRKSDGEIENLDGEVPDCLTMLDAAWLLPEIRPQEFAVVGHSFGAGVSILTAIRSGTRCKAVISYDAWLLNPQRYYWDRMRGNSNNWLSWADYCNQSVRAQLDGLMKRSAVHQAAKLECPALFFMGASYAGSVFHQSHNDLFEKLLQYHKNYQYISIHNAGHNFILYTNTATALYALKKQTEFLQKQYPALTPTANDE